MMGKGFDLHSVPCLCFYTFYTIGKPLLTFLNQAKNVFISQKLFVFVN